MKGKTMKWWRKMSGRLTDAERDKREESETTATPGDRGISVLIFSLIAWCFSLSVSNKNKLHNAVNMSTEVSEKQQNCHDIDLWGSSDKGKVGWKLCNTSSYQCAQAVGVRLKVYSTGAPLWTYGPENIHTHQHVTFLITFLINYENDNSMDLAFRYYCCMPCPLS